MESSKNEPTTTEDTFHLKPWGVRKRPIALGSAIALLTAWTVWLAYLAFGLTFRT